MGIYFGPVPEFTQGEPSGALLGGISSRFRTNPFTGRHLTVNRAHGPYLETSDGKTYIDMFMAHGTNIVGHGDARVIEANRKSLEAGVVIGYETGLSEKIANRISEIIPSAEAVRFQASGSEAVLTSIRLARAHTERDIIIRIDGQFHGGSDYVLYNQSASGADVNNNGGVPSRKIINTGGVPAVVAETIVPVPFNDLAALDVALAQNVGRVAAVILTPVDLNNGCITTDESYLAAVKEQAHAAGALLIFDEILCGFKTGLGCAQAFYNVTPDLTTLSKALSSGVPMSVVAGKRSVMETLLKPGKAGAHQGGTFAGNIAGLAAADATLDIISERGFYPELLEKSEWFYRELQAMLDDSPLPARVQSVGCAFAVYIGTREPVTSYARVMELSTEQTRRFYSECVERGVYFHTDFTISASHSRAVLEEVLDRMQQATKAVA